MPSNWNEATGAVETLQERYRREALDDCMDTSFAAQLRALVPAVAAYQTECTETVRERRSRGTGRPMDIDVGRELRDRIVKFIDRTGCARVKEIADEFDISRSGASHHLTLLLTEKRIQRRGQSHDGYEIKRSEAVVLRE